MPHSSAKSEGRPENHGPENATAHKSSPSVQPVEPPKEAHHGQASDDTHQLQRRVLHDNSASRQNEQHPETPAGQHATGSFPANSGDSQKSR
jgi:hypothetical protein